VSTSDRTQTDTAARLGDDWSPLPHTTASLHSNTRT
jgi:hypothetical protein